MTIELRYLAWAVVLGMVHAVATGQVTTFQKGAAYGLSARDQPQPVTGVPGRIVRAFSNYMQTFPFFAAAILLAHVLDRHSWLTVWGAGLYFWARVAYVPLYASGIPGPRTIAFLVAFAGIAMVLVGLT